MSYNTMNATRDLNGPGGSVTVNNSGLKATYMITVAEDSGKFGVNLDAPFGSVDSGNNGKYRLRRLMANTNISGDSSWDELICSFAEESAPGLNTSEVKGIKLTIGGASVFMEKTPLADDANRTTVLYAADYEDNVKNAIIAANGGSLQVEVEFLNATTNLSNDGAAIAGSNKSAVKSTKTANKGKKVTGEDKTSKKDKKDDK